MKQLLEQQSDLIADIPFFEHQVREGIELFKVKAILADGSNLRISEVWVDKALEKYAYYWLDESNNLLCGWDNAPHHPEISTHPHHQHVGDEVQKSSVRKLNDVLAILTAKILP